MAVESPTYINEFNEAWPDGLDSKSQGDDHIRNIKAALKRTFPNITEAVNATQAELNQLVGLGRTLQPGMVMFWPYTLETIPSGWKVCNGIGTISTGQGVPNLIDRFPVGAGSSYGVGTIGGSSTHNHAATTSIAGHSLTVSQLPPHTHGIPLGSNDTTGTGWIQASPGNSGGTNSPSYFQASQSAGLGNTHNHGATTTNTAASSLPPYYSMYYIIKD